MFVKKVHPLCPTIALRGLQILLPAIFLACLSTSLIAQEPMKLVNGLRVLSVKDDSFPVVRVSIWIRTGSQMNAVEPGLAELAVACLKPKFKDEAKLFFEQKLYRDRVELNFSCLPADLDKYLGRVLERLANIEVSQERFEAEKQRISFDAKARRNHQSSSADIAIRNAIYGARHVFSHSKSLASYDNLKLEHVKAYLAANLQPKRTMVGVWGQFTAENLFSIVKKTVGDWRAQSGNRDRLIPNATKQASPVQFLNNESSKYVELRMGQALKVSPRHPEFPAVLLLTEILRQRLSKLQNSSDCSEELWNAEFGHYYLSAQVETESAKQQVDSWIAAVSDLSNRPLNAAQISTGIAAVAKAWSKRSQTRHGKLASAMMKTYYSYPKKHQKMVMEALAALTPAQLQSNAKKHFDLNSAVLIAVGPVAKLAELNQYSSNVHQMAHPTQISYSQDKPQEKAAEKAEEVASTGEDKYKFRVAEGSTPEGKALLKKLIDAMGGTKKLADLKSVRWKGSNARITPNGTVEMNLNGVLAFPEQMRIEFSNLGKWAYTYAVNRKSAWFHAAGKEANLLPADSYTTRFKGILLSTTPILRNFHELKVSTQENEFVSGREYLVLNLERRGHGPVQFLIGDEDSRLYRRRSLVNRPDGSQVTREEVLWDYREVEGLLMPFSRTIYEDGKKNQITSLSSYEFNFEIKKDFFEVPKE